MALGEILGNIIQLLAKIFSVRLVGAIFLLCLILLFLPIDINHRLLLIPVLGTGSYLVVCAIPWAWNSGAGFIRAKHERKRIIKRLHHLSFEEKKFFQGYVGRGTMTRRFNPDSGVINGLMLEGLVFQPIRLGSREAGFPYNIEPWLLQYLRAHPEWIDTPGDTSQPDAFN